MQFLYLLPLAVALHDDELLMQGVCEDLSDDMDVGTCLFQHKAFLEKSMQGPSCEGMNEHDCANSEGCSFTGGACVTAIIQEGAGEASVAPPLADGAPSMDVPGAASTTAEPLVVCPEMAEMQVNAESGTCHVAGRSIAELAVSGLFGDNVEIKAVRYAEAGATGFDLMDIQLTVGLHPITVEAVDLAGNTRACTRHIRVLDTQDPEWSPEPPLAKFSPDFVEGECTMSSLHAINQFESLGWNGHATDNCNEVTAHKVLRSLSGEILYDSASSSTGVLSLGKGPAETYQIVYTATDPAGNQVTHTVELQLKDNESPDSIQDCPEDAYFEVEGSRGSFTHPHSWTLPSISKDNCLKYQPELFPVADERHGIEPGHEFQLGATVVAYDIRDPAGNAFVKGCDFTVTVKQKVTDPVWMQCPEDITIETEQDAEFGILPELTGSATQHDEVLDVTYDQGVASGQPFHFGTTILTMRTESGTHLAECTFKVTVNDKQRPKVDGRVYRCLDMDTDDVEPFGVCEGSKPDITKDSAFVDTHQYTVNKMTTVSKACCDDVHGSSYSCATGNTDGTPWSFKYCTPN